MTANRWWVKLFARWLARVDSIQGQVQMFSLAITAFSTFSIMLQGLGASKYIPYIGVVCVVGMVVYAWVFSEGGVWNQVNRDRQDLSSNYSNPQMKISAEMMGRIYLYAVKEGEITENDKENIEGIADEIYEKYRDGIDT